MNGTKLEGKVGRIDNTDLKAKCWDIVVRYQVNIGTFVFVTKCLKKGYEAIKENNNSVNYCVCGKGFFTEEEFDLLKEVLVE